MQCYSSTDGEVGPVVYCHNSGHDAPDIVKALAKRMAGSEGDVSYSSARLVQEAIDTYPDGNLSFGCWSASDKLTADDSHGDAGVVLIDVDNGHRCTCLGGYLKTGDDGFPIFDDSED